MRLLGYGLAGLLLAGVIDYVVIGWAITARVLP